VKGAFWPTILLRFESAEDFGMRSEARAAPRIQGGHPDARRRKLQTVTDGREGMRATSVVLFAALVAGGCGGGGDEYGDTQATAAASKCTNTAVLYADRATYLASVKKPLTDTYGVGYQSSNAGGAAYSDTQMTAVGGETRYEAITFPNVNLIVSENFWTGQAADDASTFAYCAGCNGNSTLHFDATSRSVRSRGVPSVGVDVVLHTSRHTDRGNPDPSEVSLPGTILVEFGNGQTMELTVPPTSGISVHSPTSSGLATNA
jgi:hypothetical protein